VFAKEVGRRRIRIPLGPTDGPGQAQRGGKDGIEFQRQGRDDQNINQFTLPDQARTAVEPSMQPRNLSRDNSRMHQG